jgi:2,3-bisphosphoglycerate-independent phosphoglycerate mutase
MKQRPSCPLLGHFTIFRPDRAREITRCFVDPDFKGFARKKGFSRFFPVLIDCTTQYDASMPNVEVALGPSPLPTLSASISAGWA